MVKMILAQTFQSAQSCHQLSCSDLLKEQIKILLVVNCSHLSSWSVSQEDVPHASEPEGNKTLYYANWERRLALRKMFHTTLSWEENIALKSEALYCVT